MCGLFDGLYDNPIDGLYPFTMNAQYNAGDPFQPTKLYAINIEETFSKNFNFITNVFTTKHMSVRGPWRCLSTAPSSSSPCLAHATLTIFLSLARARAAACGRPLPRGRARRRRR